VRVLLVGGGSREHALAEALKESKVDLFAAARNKNPGIAKLAKSFLQVEETEVQKIAEYAAGAKVDYAVIGPEAPLAAGLVDHLAAKKIPAVGPTQAAARLETSKEFTRTLLAEDDIPGSLEHWVFDDLDPFAAFLKDCDFEIVIKPDGLTGGKGVRVQGDHFTNAEEALECGREIIDGRIGGNTRFVVERKAIGEEFSLQAFVDGKHVVPMPLARDHKRALPGDKGPNTGGMGSFTMPDHLLPWVTPAELEEAVGILKRTVEAMHKRGTPFRGILYGGFMATAQGPRLLEYNVRFADPEGINVLLLLEDDLGKVFERLLDGTLPASVKFAHEASVCKVLAPPGYGTNPKTGGALAVSAKDVQAAGAHLFWGAVEEREQGTFLTSSRAATIAARDRQLSKAEAHVEDALKFVRGDVSVRHDIGTESLVAHYTDRMAKLRPARAPRKT